MIDETACYTAFCSARQSALSISCFCFIWYMRLHLSNIAHSGTREVRQTSTEKGMASIIAHLFLLTVSITSLITASPEKILGIIPNNLDVEKIRDEVTNRTGGQSALLSVFVCDICTCSCILFNSYRKVMSDSKFVSTKKEPALLKGSISEKKITQCRLWCPNTMMSISPKCWMTSIW